MAMQIFLHKRDGHSWDKMMIMKAQQDKKSVLNPGCFTAFDSVTNEHTDKFLIQCENQSDLYL